MLFNENIILGSKGLNIKYFSEGPNIKKIEFVPFMNNDFMLTVMETKKNRKLISELKIETYEVFEQKLKDDEINIINIFFKNTKEINYSIENKKISISIVGDFKHSVDKIHYCYDIYLQHKLESKNKPLVGKFLLDNYLHIINIDNNYSKISKYMNENRNSTEENIIDFIKKSYMRNKEISLNELISNIKSYENAEPDKNYLNDFDDESKKNRTMNISNCIQFLERLNCKETVLFESKLENNDEVLLYWRKVNEGSFIKLKFIKKDTYSCFVSNKEYDFFQYDCQLDYIPKELSEFIN